MSQDGESDVINNFSGPESYVERVLQIHVFQNFFKPYRYSRNPEMPSKDANHSQLQSVSLLHVVTFQGRVGVCGDEFTTI